MNFLYFLVEVINTILPSSWYGSLRIHTQVSIPNTTNTTSTDTKFIRNRNNRKLNVQVAEFFGTIMLKNNKTMEGDKRDYLILKFSHLLLIETSLFTQKNNIKVKRRKKKRRPTFCLTQLCRFPAMRGQSITCTEECLKKRRVSSSWVCMKPSCKS